MPNKTLLEDAIDPCSPSGLCAICDNAVSEHDEAAVVKVHSGQYLCHAQCIAAESLAEDDEI
jgi:hypothetical protein